MQDAAVSEILKHKGATVWSIPPEATVFEAIQFMAEWTKRSRLCASGSR